MELTTGCVLLCCVPRLAWSPYLEEYTAGAPAGQGYCYCYTVEDVPERPVGKLHCGAHAGGGRGGSEWCHVAVQDLRLRCVVGRGLHRELFDALH
jgi:hypothetical protein